MKNGKRPRMTAEERRREMAFMAVLIPVVFGCVYLISRICDALIPAPWGDA